jgi:hypothetical protein
MEAALHVRHAANLAYHGGAARGGGLDVQVRLARRLIRRGPAGQRWAFAGLFAGLWVTTGEALLAGGAAVCAAVAGRHGRDGARVARPAAGEAESGRPA